MTSLVPETVFRSIVYTLCEVCQKDLAKWSSVGIVRWCTDCCNIMGIIALLIILIHRYMYVTHNMCRNYILNTYNQAIKTQYTQFNSFIQLLGNKTKTLNFRQHNILYSNNNLHVCKVQDKYYTNNQYTALVIIQYINTECTRTVVCSVLAIDICNSFSSLD